MTFVQGLAYPFRSGAHQRVRFDIPAAVTFQRMWDRLSDVQTAQCVVAHAKATATLTAITPGNLPKKADGSGYLKADGVLSFFETAEFRKNNPPALGAGAFTDIVCGDGNEKPVYQGAWLQSSNSGYTPESNSAIAVRDELQALFESDALGFLRAFLTDTQINAILWTTPRSTNDATRAFRFLTNQPSFDPGVQKMPFTVTTDRWEPRGDNAVGGHDVLFTHDDSLDDTDDGDDPRSIIDLPNPVPATEMGEVKTELDDMTAGYRFIFLAGRALTNPIRPASGSGYVNASWDGMYEVPAQQNPGFWMDTHIATMTAPGNNFADWFINLNAQIGVALEIVVTDFERRWSVSTLNLAAQNIGGSPIRSEGGAFGGLGNPKTITGVADNGSGVVRLTIDTSARFLEVHSNMFAANPTDSIASDDQHIATLSGSGGASLDLSGDHRAVYADATHLDLPDAAWDAGYAGWTGTWIGKYAPLQDAKWPSVGPNNEWALTDLFTSAHLAAADLKNTQAGSWKRFDEQGNELAGVFSSVMHCVMRHYTTQWYEFITGLSNFGDTKIYDYDARAVATSIYPETKLDSPTETLLSDWRNFPSDRASINLYVGRTANSDLSLWYDRRELREIKGLRISTNWDWLTLLLQRMYAHLASTTLETICWFHAFSFGDRGGETVAGTETLGVGDDLSHSTDDTHITSAGDYVFTAADNGRYVYLTGTQAAGGVGSFTEGLYLMSGHAAGVMTLDRDSGSGTGTLGNFRVYSAQTIAMGRHRLRLIALGNFTDYFHWWTGGTEPSQQEADWIDDVFTEVETKMGGTASTMLVEEPLEWDSPIHSMTIDCNAQFLSFALVRPDLLASGSGTDLATASDTAVSSATVTFDETHEKLWLNITAGTGYTVGRYQILSTAGGVATLDRAVGTHPLTGGTFALSNYGDDGTDAKVNTNRYGTDLHINAIDDTLVDSVGDTHHAQRSDIGKTLRIHSGTGFTAGDYEIVDVVITRDSTGITTASAWELDGDAGTGGSTGGVFSILDERAYPNGTINEVVELTDYAAAWITQTDLEPAA